MLSYNSIIKIIKYLYEFIFSDRENLLLNKNVFSNDNRNYIKNINDGNRVDTCVQLNINEMKWAVFDLEQIYDVQTIVIWNNKCMF